MYKACVGTGAGGGGACHPRILADWLTLFKPGGQITTWHLQLQNPNTALYIVQVNLCQKLFFLQNIGRTCCVQKLI